MPFILANSQVLVKEKYINILFCCTNARSQFIVHHARQSPYLCLPSAEISGLKHHNQLQKHIINKFGYYYTFDKECSKESCTN